MNLLSRTTRGGVGALLMGLGLTAFALSAGWTLGSSFEGEKRAEACVSSCEASTEPTPVRSSRTGSVAGLASRPSPTPTLPAGFPYISAKSVTAIEWSCGGVIWERDSHLRLPPASLTKLMTAAVAIEQAPTDTIITSHVDGAALYDETGSTIMGLTEGMQLSLLDLLYGLLLPSGNDAAIAIAEGVSGSESAFVALMNAKVESLGLRDTHFANPHGLDAGDLYSSAHDMGMLARYVMQNPTLREIVATVSWQPAWDGPEVWNGNAFIGQYEGADGVKIGYTEESQQTIVASATRGERRIIVSVMKSLDRYSDSSRLLDWAFEQPSPCP